MKTRVIPAQITTVEDKIAGSLSLTQILLLMTPVFWTAMVYALFMPQLKFAMYKVPVIGVVLLISLFLAIRIKEKLILNWLMVLVTYNMRPKYYVFNKNERYLRAMDMPSFTKQKNIKLKKSLALNQNEAQSKTVSLRELIKLDGILTNPKYTLSLKSTKKGGLNVAIQQTHE